jgi:formylglycine-generating enzyme required for sulfatase activity
MTGTARVNSSYVSNTGTGSPAYADMGAHEWLDDVVHWVAIPGGTFDMGDGPDADELPVHSVTLQDFEMTRTEVTVSQYQECVDAAYCTPSATGTDCTGAMGNDHLPINCVNWDQANAFCTWASDPDSSLPSEAQWEYAARSMGLAVEYPWGDDAPSCDYAMMDFGGDGCGSGEPGEVCQRTDGNTYQGLCDMSGNVAEWIADWYHATYTNAPDDGSAWLSPAGTVRVVRGGSYNQTAGFQRLADRVFDHEDPVHYDDFGFRCVR